MTKIKLFFTLLFLFCVALANAQQAHVDSLKQQLSITNEDSVKIGLANQISIAYSNTNLDSMVLYSRKTIQLLQQLLTSENADNVKLQILWYISDMYQYVSNDSMVFYSQQALLLCIKNRNSFHAVTEAQSLSNLASSLWWAGNYPGAKETYFKALKVAEPIGDTILTASIYVGIAMVNRNAGDFRQAITNYTKAENLTRSIPDNNVLESGAGPWVSGCVRGRVWAEVPGQSGQRGAWAFCVSPGRNLWHCQTVCIHLTQRAHG